MNKEIVLSSIPITNYRYPNNVIYQLKSCLTKANITSRCFDFNRDYKEYFKSEHQLVLDCLCSNIPDEYILKRIIKFNDDFIKNKVLPLQPKWFGISIFTKDSFNACKILSNSIRKYLPNTKIILGGNVFTYDKTFNGDGIEHDYIIRGDGEKALIKLLKTQQQPEIIYGDINNNPIPDYEDYFKDYGVIKRITMNTSLGCVNHCHFCNIDVLHPIKRYRFMTAENIVNQMIYFKNKYNLNVIEFSSSIMNGNNKEFKRFIYLLNSSYEKKLFGPVYWGGNFAIENASLVENDFVELKKSKVEWVTIGVESASENVRKLMNKRFTNDKLYYYISNFLDNNIRIVFNILTGYPNETEEDFQETIDFLKYYSKYLKKLKLKVVVASLHLKGHIKTQTDLIQINNFDEGNFWRSRLIPDLDFPKRYERRKKLVKIAKDLGYVVKDTNDENNVFNNLLETYYKHGVNNFKGEL